MTKKEAIDTLKLMQAQVEWEYPMDYAAAIDMAVAALGAEPEPAIPISWLKKEIKRLESYENSFALLDAMQLKVLIKRWRGKGNG